VPQCFCDLCKVASAGLPQWLGVSAIHRVKWPMWAAVTATSLVHTKQPTYIVNWPQVGEFLQFVEKLLKVELHQSTALVSALLRRRKTTSTQNTQQQKPPSLLYSWAKQVRFFYRFQQSSWYHWPQELLEVSSVQSHTVRNTAFLVVIAKLWNSLPDDIVSATSHSIYCHLLETFLKN